jgi:hypothetical protein
VQHLFSGPRLPFTGAYFGSIALTIYFSIGVSSASLPLLVPVILQRTLSIPDTGLSKLIPVDFMITTNPCCPTLPYATILISSSHWKCQDGQANHWASA